MTRWFPFSVASSRTFWKYSFPKNLIIKELRQVHYFSSPHVRTNIRTNIRNQINFLPIKCFPIFSILSPPTLKTRCNFLPSFDPVSSPINVGSHHKRRPTQFPVGNKWNLVLAAIISSVLPDFVKIVNVIVQFSSTNTLTVETISFKYLNKRKIEATQNTLFVL